MFLLKGKLHMRKDLGAKTFIYPMPVLIIGTYDEKGEPDAMNAAWGGIYDYSQITISLGAHVSTDNIRKNKGKAFDFFLFNISSK